MEAGSSRPPTQVESASVGRTAGGRRVPRCTVEAEDGTPAKEKEGEDKTVLLMNEATNKKWGSFRTRTLSTVFMLGGFVSVIYFGHVFVWALVVLIQTVMVSELFKHAQQARSERQLPGFRFLQWYFFLIVTFFTHMRFVKTNLWEEISAQSWKAHMFGWLVKNDAIISYLMYIGGFVMFVARLRKSHYMYQFGQYGWTHMILLVIVIQSSCFVANIFEGLWWFLMPTLLVILNDIMAYLSGFFFGRTPLTSLSPKKTWEGFAGGLVFTVVGSFFLGHALAQWKWMTCPRTDFARTWLDCEVSPVYEVQTLDLYEAAAMLPHWLEPSVAALVKFSGHSTVEVAPIQLHALVLATFASIIAPFGGFFASGFKRAFKIKDFGDSIPGHGGLTDRMDCQVVMAVFANIYYNTFVKLPVATVASLLQTIETLPAEARVQLYTKLGNMLVGDRIIDEASLPDLAILRLNRH